MEKEYISILYQFVFKESIYYIIGFVVLSCFLMLQLIKERSKKEITGCVVLLILVIFGISYNFITVELDIKNNSIVEMEYSTGSYHPEGDPQFLVKPYWFKGDEITEELSVVTDVPKSLENGKVIYSKRSKVLLDYTAENEEDW